MFADNMGNFLSTGNTKLDPHNRTRWLRGLLFLLAQLRWQDKEVSRKHCVMCDLVLDSDDDNVHDDKRLQHGLRMNWSQCDWNLLLQHGKQF